MNTIISGIHRNGKTRLKNSISLRTLAKNYIPVFDKQGKLIINIPQKKFKFLFHSYLQTKSIQFPTLNDMENINKQLNSMAARQRLHTSTKKWTINNKIIKLIMHEFNTHTERFTDPLSTSTLMDKFYSEHATDKTFGAKTELINQPWFEHSYINAIHFTKDKLHMILKKAIKESKNRNTNTIIITTEKNMKHDNNISMANLHQILTWQDGMQLQASINCDNTKSIEEKIGLYIISKNLQVSDTFKSKITNISQDINGYTPTFLIDTTEDHQPPQTRPRLTTQHDNTMTKTQIADYKIINTLRALGVPDPQKTTNKILTMLTRGHDIGLSRFDNPQHTDITEHDIFEAKKKLKKYIISELDKNNGQLYVACPKVEEQRLKANIEDCENFEERKGLTTKYVLDGIYTKYRKLKLDKIERWQKGAVPYMYSTPKHKDPINKTRIIASYFNFPLKRLYKLASKAGNWLLRKLPKQYRHFTLHSVGQVKDRLHEGIHKLRNCYKKKTELFCFQSDVKCMFTFL